MPADLPTLTGWIALVIGEAPRLRAAGVLSLSAEGCTVQLAPLTAPLVHGEIAAPDATVDDGTYPSPLYDPHTYPGGIVPGFPAIERRERFDEE